MGGLNTNPNMNQMQQQMMLNTYGSMPGVSDPTINSSNTNNSQLNMLNYGMPNNQNLSSNLK